MGNRLLHPDRRRLPLWLKLALTAFLLVLIPVYWRHYGPANFLWFSDITLLLAAMALWTGQRLLASVAAVISLVPELAWNLDFLVRLLSGRGPMNLAHYMFDATWPLYLRGLSLFHVALPPLLLYLVHRLGYERRAFWWAVGFSCIVLPLSWAVGGPEKNLNWTWGPGQEPQERLPPPVYLSLLMLFVPVAFFIPAHLFLSWWRPTTGSVAADTKPSKHGRAGS